MWILWGGGLKIAIFQWQGQSPLTQGWRYRAARNTARSTTHRHTDSHTNHATSVVLTIENESVRKIIINDTINLFLKLQWAFWQFQNISVSGCCLKKLLPCILFEKNIFTFYHVTLRRQEPAWYSRKWGDSVAEWLACWIQAQNGLGSNRNRDAVG